MAHQEAELTRRLLLRRKVFTATGKRRRFQSISPRTFRTRFMYELSPNKSQAETRSRLKSVVSSAYYWQTWKGSQLRSYQRMWVSSFKAGKAYLLL